MTTPQPPEQSQPASVPPPAAGAAEPAAENPWQRPAPEATPAASGQAPAEGDASPHTAAAPAPVAAPDPAGVWPNQGVEVPGPQEAAPPRTDNGSRRLLLAGGVGVLAGALIVGILWAASSFVGGGGGNDAEADAAAACGVFERVPDTWQPETLTDQTTYQLGGAIALAQAAGNADEDYRVLAAQAQQVQQAVVTFNLSRVAQLVVDVRNTCNEL
ncbi:hypothetical protein [Paractinoplanes lichenicola]|uniref:Uncharacterized protein n=1 Tax=Paractinoplanes lichenicola TaxID=2802976 RepID=A0ABS1VY86_9ACTN|nr:hypothetical protein [Actinoplanes lichenicola]MBL7259447.1 hypothetical protein [Actinoplanes lichenicola]